MLRQANEKDIEQIVRLVSQTIESIYPQYYPHNVVQFFLQLHTKVSIQKDVEAKRIWIKQKQEQIISCGTVSKNHITRVFTHPAFQKQVYGTCLLHHLECVIKNNYEPIVLEASLPAVIFYEKLGYHTIRHEQIKWEDAILVYDVMEKR